MNTSQDFILEYEIGVDDLEVRLPTRIVDGEADFNYFKVDWGDGSSAVVKPNEMRERLHLYKQKGVYTVRCDGIFFNLSFFNLGRQWFHRLVRCSEKRMEEIIKITVRQWGSLIVQKDDSFDFSNCYGLALDADDAPDLSSIKKLDYTFSYSGVEFKKGIELWDVSDIESFRFMFRETDNPLPSLEKWKVRDDADLEGMFDNCHGETPIPSWYKRWQAKQKAEITR